MAGKPVSTEDVSNEFIEISHTYRGITYTIRELPFRQYQRTVKSATPEIEENGTKVERYDADAHMAILMDKCLVAPEIDAEALYGKGTRLIRQLQRNIQALHWEEEPETDEDPTKIPTSRGS